MELSFEIRPAESGDVDSLVALNLALAHETGCPIVPVAHNAGDFWPRRGLAKTPGKILFCIGPPIEPGDRKPKELNLVAQEWIEGKMNEISSIYKERANAN